MSPSETCFSAHSAIILAAGELPPDLQIAFGKTSSAMLPVNGRPTIHWSLHYLRECGIKRVILAIRQEEVRLQKFVRQCFESSLDLEFVQMQENRGPGYSLAKCFERLPPPAPCLVVLGDTLFAAPKLLAADRQTSFVLTSKVADAGRWCLAEIGNDSNLVRNLRDKPASNPGDWPALIGVYHLQDSGPASAALDKEIAAGNRSIQLSHALEPYIASGSLRAWPAAEWYDCGHADFLDHSRRRLLKAREFNELELDDLRGTITKRSKHTEKFLGEINYYRLLPDDLAPFFPRLLGYSVRPSEAYLTLEYYGYSTLSELWVFEKFDASFWHGVFRQISRILACFAEYELSLSSSVVFHFYWTKTADRVECFARQSPEARRLAEAPGLSLNGKMLTGWPLLRESVEAAVREICTVVPGQIIHGDLCFPNILFDPVGRIFKFIDPRGSFGEAGLFGDARYDLAKLLHSIHGGYDFLIHDMFSLEQEGSSIELQQFFPDYRPAVLQHFEEVFGSCAPMREIRLIEGLLFISMCALHQDAPQRQIAMFAIGLRILNEALAGKDGFDPAETAARPTA